MSDAVASFRRLFDGHPQLVVRAPGRVNLIGEHIDYNGLSVLPMAIPRVVSLAVRFRTDGLVRLRNADPRFKDRSFQLAPDARPYAAGDWGDYPKAAARALADEYGTRIGFDAAVTSDLPPASGLSSSSALVIATGLAVAAVNGIEVPTAATAALMARAERFVGTQGGGMDQAISLGAVAGNACRVDFDPLSLTHVPMPRDWRVVVASSLVPAEKSGAAREAYNQRTRECAEALEVVWTEVAQRGQGPVPPSGPTYRSLLALVGARHLLDLGERLLSPTLLGRFRHVVTEAHRVTLAEEAMRAGDIHSMGSLLSDSHTSLRDDYEVSSPELDRLVEIAMDGGAQGARLTGAGFGGCVIALADSRSVQGVMETLGREFFLPAGREPGPGDHLFVAEPAGGATVEWL